MLNGEKYKDEIAKVGYDFGFYDNDFIYACECHDYNMCNTCKFNNEAIGCRAERIKWLLEEYKEPIKPILTEKEKAYLKNVIEPYGNNTAYVCRFITETLRKEFLSICINVDENSINSFEIPLIHGLKTWYKNMVLDKEYSLEELGL